MADNTKNSDSIGPLGSTAAGANRFDRPLGRGLEEVSHLFLSKDRSSEHSEAAWTRPGSDVAAHSGTQALGFQGTMLLKSHRSVNKEWLTTALRRFDGALEEGLLVVDVKVQTDAYGEIDLVAIDQANQLVVIDADALQNDALLLRGIAHIDWMGGNVATLRRLYQGHAINFSLRPRLVLVAPRFSRLLRSVANQVGQPRITLVTYQAVELPGGTGVFFGHPEDG